MHLFCDTSALIKLFFEETDSDFVRTLVKQADNVVVSRVTWAEAYSGTARRFTEMNAFADERDTFKQAFQKVWDDCIVVEVNQALVELAGEYAQAFNLRGFDSIQLASASFFAKRSKESVLFACFDKRLNSAAKILGMDIQAP